MSLRTRVEPIEQSIAVLIEENLSPRAISGMIAEEARRAIAEAQGINADAFGHPVAHRTFVDGSAGKGLEQVRPDGKIVATFDLWSPVLRFIRGELVAISPYVSGAFVNSQVVFADGEEIKLDDGVSAGGEVLTDENMYLLGDNLAGATFIFVAMVEYARLLELGWSDKAPDGIYQVVAQLAHDRFGSFCDISFGWREVAGIRETRRERRARPYAPRDLRQPAIFARLK